MLNSLKRNPGVFAIVFAIVLAGLAPMALAADPPVGITFTVSGDPVPGATVTAKATVTINDGSTLQSIKWTQTGGASAVLSNTTTDTVTVVMPSRKVLRDRLIHVLEEAPLPADQIPPKAGEYHGGLQDRFTVVSASPLALEHTGAIELEAEVVTSSGTYHAEAAIHGTLPWPHTMIGTRNVPVMVPVILQGKDQATWNWTLIKPAGSSAVLLDSTSRNPEFTPDVPGTYEVRVTDLEANEQVSLTIHAGKWEGLIVGQTAEGRPVADPSCKTCHVPSTPHFDLFTPWAKSGHAEIFTQNVNNPAGHYSGACVSCHSVGLDTNAANNGMDDQPDFQALLDSGLVNHGGLENWTQILDQFPKSARFANIQCENCHGPHDGVAHMKADGSRKTQSSDLCGTCHGEPARHGRYQQWQLSAHANYQLAEDEAGNATCAKCHTSQGFIQWEMNNFSTASLKIDWKPEEAHPVTCVACHDPHYVGTTSGGPTTNATVRVSGTTPALTSGFTATNVGRGAICMTCHNGRRGLRNDSNFSLAAAGTAPHQGPQADILMGQNMYFVQTGVRSNHANIEDACVTCHMEATPPPAELSYNLGGTNHTFYARPQICTSCHTSITLQSVQGPIEEKMHSLKHEIEVALKGVMQTQIRLG
ncbi:MAG: cytochrome c3 family protein, partial [Thermoanaerobaculia bacterium]